MNIQEQEGLMGQNFGEKAGGELDPGDATPVGSMLGADEIKNEGE